MNEITIDIIKMILAIGLGFLIGIERERSGKPAGSRTLALVCLGSAFATLIGAKFVTDDPTRVLQGIITGIGFLGAGAIIAHGTNVTGLTTAAAIWAVSIVGIGVGMGEYVISILFAALVYFVLIERRIEKIEKEIVEKVKRKKKD